MMWKVVFVAAMAVNTLGQYLRPSLDTLLLARAFPRLNPLTNDALNGPDEISHAPTTQTTNQMPSKHKMKYYNNYAAAMYCQYELKDLDCEVCKKFNKDVDSHIVLMNNISDNTALVTLSNSRKEIVITYRGTQNIWNVLEDVLLLNLNFDGALSDIRLHSGFYIATVSLYENVVLNVGYLLSQHEEYKIIIVGHSLGAAMARITYLLLLHTNQFPGTEYELYTYGEPRVGNKALADFMNNQTITTARIVNGGDIVPHLPATSVMGTKLQGDYYIHPQPEYWLNGKKGQFCTLPAYEDPTCSDSLGLAYNIADHLLYFDVNYATCSINQGILPAPFDVFQPVSKEEDSDTPLPQPISNFDEATNYSDH